MDTIRRVYEFRCEACKLTRYENSREIAIITRREHNALDIHKTRMRISRRIAKRQGQGHAI